MVATLLGTCPHQVPVPSLAGSTVTCSLWPLQMLWKRDCTLSTTEGYLASYLQSWCRLCASTSSHRRAAGRGGCTVTSASPTLPRPVGAPHPSKTA